MTRPRSDYEAAARLLDAGLSQAEAARRTGIPRSTIRDWLRKGPAAVPMPAALPGSSCDHALDVVSEAAYAYLLGLYLGDGCISLQHRGVYRLRITLDTRYPGIIGECERAMAVVLPNRVSRVPRPGCTEVGSSSKHWPCLFPQHGAGPKHERRILLELWQEHVGLEKYPRLLLRGLVHSDGWRGDNVAVTPRGRYRYPRYLFSNRSDDVRAIFAAGCAQLGVIPRRANRWNLSVARKDDVALFDQFIGPKR